MQPSPPSSPGETARPLPRERLLWAAAAILLAIYFFSPARELMDASLDGSNYATYAYFTAHEFQYGTDVLVACGPYGFVQYGFLYAGNLFWKRLPLELLTKLVLGLLTVWFIRRAAGGWLRWLWLAVFLLLAPLIDDLPYDFALLLAGWWLLENHFAPERRQRAIGCALSGFLALLTLMKGTQPVLGLGILGLLAVQAIVARNFRRLPWFVGSYALALLVLLAAAGQDPLGFPLWLRGILEQSAGYNAAMPLEEPTQAFLTGVGALVCLEALIAVLILPSWRRPETLACGALLAVLTFVEWKHGFVRADGHVYIFYQYACIAAPTILLLALKNGAAVPPSGWRRLAGGLAAAAMLLTLVGVGTQTMQMYRWSILHNLPPQLAEAIRQVALPRQAKARLDGRLGTQRAMYDMPLIRETVGAASIDFFGTEHGYLMLNRLNYRPRPMGGGAFSVFTPWLQQRNAAYLANPATRPAYYLVRLVTVDNRLLAQDDATTLRDLIDRYAPVQTEQGLVLFKARPDPAVPPTPRLLKEEAIVFGRPVEVPAAGPGEMVLASLTLPLNPAGRLRAFLYKPPLVFMNLEGDSLENAVYRRVVPGMFTRPVVLSPALEDTRDLLALYQAGPGKTVRRFTLNCDHPGFFAAGRFTVKFYAAPRPPPLPAGESDRLLRLLRFPVANVPPALIEPAKAPRRLFVGFLAQMLEPPGRICFDLTGRENAVDFKFGIDPEAYETGRTDGVDFYVELLRPSLPPQQLFRRLLRPATHPGDRGCQLERVALPPSYPGCSLVLRTDAGPDHDSAWDWAWFSGIRLLQGSYLPEAFPNFSVVPLAADAATCGRLIIGNLDVFLLNAPGRLFFALPASARRLVFGGGLLRGAYTQGGNSDGADFIVEFQLPDGSIRPVFRRTLNPRDNPADRGTINFEVPLPDRPAGTQLIVATGPGPSGSNAWDWTYLEHFDLE